MADIVIYTDGAAHPNPGKGGYAAIIRQGGEERIVSGGFAYTTNNRMEILAVAMALESLDRPSQVLVVSDSKYVIDGRRWAVGWRAKHWWTPDGRRINADLWARLLAACERHTEVEFRWIRGHTGHAENERCDRLALAESKRATVKDHGYEEQTRVGSEAALF